MAIKDLVPQSLRPAAKRLQGRARRLVEMTRSTTVQVPTGPAVTDVAIADEHAVTFLVSARQEVSGLTARLAEDRNQREIVLKELHRYQKDGRHFVLASLTLDEPARVGETITLLCDEGEIAAAGARIHETRDVSHPLIQRVVLISDKGKLRFGPGTPRVISGPVLLGVTAEAESVVVRVESDATVVGGRVYVRDTDTYLACPGIGAGFEIPAAVLAEACSSDDGEAVLLGLQATGEDGGTWPIGHSDPWVRLPRHYETFAPITVDWEQRRVLVRPYWTLGGVLALKVRNR